MVNVYNQVGQVGQVSQPFYRGSMCYQHIIPAAELRNHISKIAIKLKLNSPENNFHVESADSVLSGSSSGPLFRDCTSVLVFNSYPSA